MSGILFAKNYGAQRIYCVKQGGREDDSVKVKESEAENISAELESLKSSIDSESESLEIIRKKVSLQQQMRLFSEKESQLLGTLRVMHKQISCLESNNSQQGAFADMGDELRATFDRVSQEFARRKRIANDLLGFLSETADMSRRDLIDELGLESVPSTVHTPQSNFSPSRGC